jgi:hypothetical protein
VTGWLFVCTAVVGPPQQAIAYSRGGVAPEDGTVISNCGAEITWKFTNPFGYPWSQAQKERVRAAFAEWETLDNLDGGRIVDWVETSGSVEVHVQRYDFPGNKLGEADCEAGYLRLDTSLSGDALEGVAAHEAGHITGLAHVSHEENLTTAAPPTMTSGACPADPAALRTTEHDDYAALMQRNGQTAGAFRRMHADPSFEEALAWTDYWETVDVASVEQIADANSPWGGYHLRFKGLEPLTGPDPILRQDVLVLRPGTYDMGAWVRRAPDAAGTVTLKLAQRPWTKFTGDSATCDIGPSGDWLASITHTFTPTESWVFWQTDEYSASGGPHLQIRVNVINELRNGSNRAYARVDVVAARAQ